MSQRQGLTSRAYGASMVVLAIIGMAGLGAALLLPTQWASQAVDA